MSFREGRSTLDRACKPSSKAAQLLAACRTHAAATRPCIIQLPHPAAHGARPAEVTTRPSSSLEEWGKKEAGRCDSGDPDVELCELPGIINTPPKERSAADEAWSRGRWEGACCRPALLPASAGRPTIISVTWCWPRTALSRPAGYFYRLFSPSQPVRPVPTVLPAAASSCWSICAATSLLPWASPPLAAKPAAPASGMHCIVPAPDSARHHRTPVNPAMSTRRWLLGLLVLQSSSSFVLDSYQELLKDHLVVTLFLTMLVGGGSGDCAGGARWEPALVPYCRQRLQRAHAARQYGSKPARAAHDCSPEPRVRRWARAATRATSLPSR